MFSGRAFGVALPLTVSVACDVVAPSTVNGVIFFIMGSRDFQG